MPEYLAPAVYVEEVDTGSKPIEGVSTSTAGVIGVTERGPIGVPILVTSYGEYVRWFGGTLRVDDFAGHSYLPHAVEGFFTNGGKRVFVTRVLDRDAATKAAQPMMYDANPAASISTVLLRAAAEATGTAANPPGLVILPIAGPNANDWVRIGDGSAAEYRQATGASAGEDVMVPLTLPLSRSHADGSTVRQRTRTAAGVALTLAAAARAGDTSVVVSGATADVTALAGAITSPDQCAELGSANVVEYRFVLEATQLQVTGANATLRLRLDAPLQLAHATTDPVSRIDLTGVAGDPSAVVQSAPAGSALLFVDARNGDFDTRGLLVHILGAGQEARPIGSFTRLPIAGTTASAYPAGSFISAVTLDPDERALTVAAATGATSLTLDDTTGLVIGQQLRVGAPGPAQDEVTISALEAGNLVRITTVVANAHGIAHARHLAADWNPGDSSLTLDDATDLVVGQQLRVGAPGAQELVTITAVAAGNVVSIAPAAVGTHLSGLPVDAIADSLVTLVASELAMVVGEGTRVLPLSNRLGLTVGDVLLVGAGVMGEYVTILSLPALSGLAPDPGNVVVFPSLAHEWPARTPVTHLHAPAPIVGRQVTALAVDAPAGANQLYVTDGSTYAALEAIQVTTPGGDFIYHVISAAPAPPTAEVLELTTALERAHRAGSAVVGREPLFNVEALDAGSWGNRIRISVTEELAGLVSRTTLATIVDPRTIRLASPAGVQAGTVLELFDITTGATVGDPVKITTVNRAANYTLQLAAPLAPGQQVVGLGVRSREFALTVHVLRQPDPAMPSRNDQVEASETFRYLSMDPRHSNYIERVIGATNGPVRLADQRPEGSSMFVRVRDLAANTAQAHGVRLGPETLVDVLPSGERRPARHALEQVRGTDSIVTLGADHYVGADDPNPERRTGLQALRNIEEISIVACPGQSAAPIQNALIAHCELMRYRFAVLDGNAPPNDMLASIQAQRQRYDSKYAALYHPWLLIPDPYPQTPAQPPDYPIPPSGHVIGVYARVDIERGVHKAPANEVVRGVTGLQRVLNKEQQDILNPFPVNINVIRDFRANNRGIRVYGGRVITSDSDWKYVNVRRLLIFIEASIDRGLQWVVFEPNAEPLWARVRRSITNFLTLVWRNGGLEGTKPEEAFFVKCDRTTMTQTDIDSGRLICLVGVAPVKPAEFVIVRIGLWTAHADE